MLIAKSSRSEAVDTCGAKQLTVI